MAYTFFKTFKTNAKNIYGNTLNGYEFGIDVYIEQSNAVNNYTNVKTVSWVMMNSNSSTVTSSTYYFKQDNVTYQNIYIKLGVKDTAGYATPYHSNEKITKYYHNADGTKSITLNFSVETEVAQSANANLNNYCFKSASIIENITLPTINRLSPFSFSGSFTMGTGGEIKISPYVSSFTHTVSYSFGNTSGTIGTNVGEKITWSPSKDLGHQIPNSTSGVGTITVATYNGSTHIGSTSQQFTLWVSGDMYPTFTYTHASNNAFNGLLLTSRSTSTFQIQNATGSYGSTIKSYSISGEGINTTNSSGTTSTYSSSGTFSYTLKVTDSRGRTATQTKSVSVYYYAKPSVTMNVTRCDASGKADDRGNYILPNIKWNITNPNNANQNAKTIKVEYKESTLDSWSTLYAGTLNAYVNAGGLNFTNYNITFDSSKSYNVRTTVSDSFNTTTVEADIATSTCILDIEPLGVGIGKYHQHGSLDVLGDIYVDDVKFFEEGTFSPSFYCGSGTSMVFTRREGNYQKIGKWCHFTISLQAEYFVAGSTSSQLTINNFPFVNAGTYTACTIGYCKGIKTGTSNNLAMINCYIRPNESQAVFVYSLEDGSVGTVNGSRSDSMLDIQISGCYKVQ